MAFCLPVVEWKSVYKIERKRFSYSPALFPFFHSAKSDVTTICVRHWVYDIWHAVKPIKNAHFYLLSANYFILRHTHTPFAKKYVETSQPVQRTALFTRPRLRASTLTFSTSLSAIRLSFHFCLTCVTKSSDWKGGFLFAATELVSLRSEDQTPGSWAFGKCVSKKRSRNCYSCARDSCRKEMKKLVSLVYRFLAFVPISPIPLLFIVRTMDAQHPWCVFCHRDEFNPFWMVENRFRKARDRTIWKGKELSTFCAWLYNAIEGTEGWGGVALSNLGISAQASGGIRLLHQKKKTWKQRLAFLFFFLLVSFIVFFSLNDP